MSRPLKAQIHLQAIRHNYAQARRQASGACAVAVVKADAYGHGAVPVAKALDQDVDALGVASIDEALELRAAGIQSPILLLEGFFHVDELPLLVQHGLWCVLHSVEQIGQLEQFVLRQPSISLRVWLKVDSGMHRLGLTPTEVADALVRLQRLPQIAALVLMSHFACADEPQQPKTAEQLQIMHALQAQWQLPMSLSNSAALLHWPQSHAQWVRPGIMLYGASPFMQPELVPSDLQAGMTLSTEIIAIREVEAGESVGYGATWVSDRHTRIATLAVGYADGYPRHARNGTPVWLHGRPAELAGRVSMDMITIDLSAHPQARVGDQVELWGENLTVTEVARDCMTIPYTLLSGLTRRVPRCYDEG